MESFSKNGESELYTADPSADSVVLLNKPGFTSLLVEFIFLNNKSTHNINRHNTALCSTELKASNTLGE